MQDKNDYYVYLHENKTTGEVFYVGKGRGRRINKVSGRSTKWKEYVSLNNGFTSRIVKENLSNKEALELESKLIEQYKQTAINKSKSSKIIENLLDYSEYFYYDEESPTFLRWKKVHQSSKKKPGDIAGCFCRGYVVLMCNRKKLLGHRVVWVICNNREIPENMVINHIDCNPSNNSISNLECISQEENNRKKFCHTDASATISTNKSGITGVHLAVSCGKYKNYTSSWQENEKQKTKSFSIAKFGEQLAFELACEWRKVKEHINIDTALSKELEQAFYIKYKHLLNN